LDNGKEFSTTLDKSRKELEKTETKLNSSCRNKETGKTEVDASVPRSGLYGSK
jgi:hypothetical protein